MITNMIIYPILEMIVHIFKVGGGQIWIGRVKIWMGKVKIWIA
jgi:hypothetical protein